MLQRDMAAARQRWIEDAKTEAERAERERSDFLIPETDDGRADFHALRHTIVSSLAGSGVHPELAKELARHSTITLTMDRYAHVGLLDMNAAVESLRGVPDRTQEGQKSVATGTDAISVAPKVALEPVQLMSNQETSQKTAAVGDDSSGGRNMDSHEELSEEVITPEEWWGGDLNGFPQLLITQQVRRIRCLRWLPVMP